MKNLITLLLLFWAFVSHSQNLYFPPTAGDTWETNSISDLSWCEDEMPSLLSFLEESQTRAFIVLKDGKIVIEEYFDGHTQDSVWYWASAGKSLNAFEIGMLQEAGSLDIEAPTSDYLGLGWTSCTGAEEELITVKHQLSMTTGLDYNFGDLDCTTADCLHCLNEPNTEWYYHNAPYTLLSDVIENVSGRTHTLHTFLTLGSTVGILGGWIPLGNNKTFFSTPRVMARFGLLMNANGIWNGTTVLGDQEYLSQMTTPSQSINESYGYLWWLNTGPTVRLPGSTITFQGKIIPDAPEHIYMALGKNSQILIVDPIENVVIVRMGDDPDESAVPTIFLNSLWDEVADVICASTATESVVKSDVILSPNPVEGMLSISSEDMITGVAILNTQGQLLIKNSIAKSIDMSSLPTGVYLVAVSTLTGQQIQKIVKY